MSNYEKIKDINRERVQKFRRYRNRYFLGISFIILSFVILCLYSVIEPFLTKVLFEGMVAYSEIAWLVLFFGVFSIGMDIMYKTGLEESELPAPIQLVSGIDDYNDLLCKVNQYASNHRYHKQELYLNDTRNDEYFTMYTNDSNPVEVIGVYYSNMYYAEDIGYTRYGIKKEIRLSNVKNVNAQCAPVINLFCGKKEDKYLKRDLSLPPKPINKIFVVMIDPKEKNQSNWEQWLLEEGHEQHVLFVLIYEDKPECIYIGPDNRRYADESYMGAIQVLNEMLQLNIDVSKL